MTGPSAPDQQGLDAALATDADGEAVTVRRGAKALATAGDRVLLIEERRPDGSTFWTLPGGGLEPGESLRACLQREVAEELQTRVDVGDPVRTCRYRHTRTPRTVSVYTVFEAAISNPEPNADEGVLAYDWYRPGHGPPTLLDPVGHLLRTLAPDG